MNNTPMMTNNTMNVAQVESQVRGFLTRTYLWMTLALLVTGVTAYVTANSESIQRLVYGSPWAWLVLIILQFGIVIALSAAISKMSPIVATIVFFLYAALTGVVFSVLVFSYTGTSIASTFVVTSGLFGIMAIYGLTTHRDLTAVGTLGFMALLGIILMGLVNLFLRNETIYWIISIVGVLIFVGLIAYDNQKLRRMATQVDVNSDQGQKASILGALALYLDFINLFLFLLRLMGRRS